MYVCVCGGGRRVGGRGSCLLGMTSSQRCLNKETEDEDDGDNCYVPDTDLGALMHFLT